MKNRHIEFAIATLLIGAAVLLPMVLFTGCKTESDTVKRSITWEVNPAAAGTVAQVFITKTGGPVAASVADGTVYMFKVADLSGYTVSITVDGAALTADINGVYTHTVNADVTITAAYTLAYWLIYVANSADSSIAGMPKNQLLESQSIDKPDPDPTRTNYTFEGWYTESAGGAEIEFPFMLEEHITIYAHWTAWPVVTFTGSGEPIDVPVAKGAPVTQPSTTARNLTAEEMKTLAGGQAGLYALNAAFLGWFDDDGSAWDFDDPVVDDMALTAKWDHRRLNAQNDDYNLNDAISYVSDKNEAFLMLLSEDQSLWGYRHWPNLSNTNLTILATGDHEIKIALAPGDNWGYLFCLNDAQLTIGNNITLFGVEGKQNDRPVVFLGLPWDEKPNPPANDSEKTVFTMLPGSKVTGNKNWWERWGRIAGVEIKHGLLIVDGAEISGNDFVIAYGDDTNPGYRSGGISSYTEQDGDYKIIVKGNSKIQGNILDADGNVIEESAIRVWPNKGKGALTISGNAQIGVCNIKNEGSWRGVSSIVVEGPWTGEIELRNFNMDNSLVYGADTYTLTPADLSHITLPDGYIWNLKPDNSASVLVDD